MHGHISWWTVGYIVAALLPCICIVSLTYLQLQSALSDWRTTNTMLANERLMVQASHLTRELQLERGLTAMINRSQDNPALTKRIASQRSRTDHLLDTDFKAALSASHIDPSIRDSVGRAIATVGQIRSDADGNPDNWQEIFSAYSGIIQQTLDASFACVMAKTDRGIGKVFGKIAIDQSARESLGQIRGMISASIARDRAPTESQKHYILEHYDRVVGYLDSPIRQLGNGMTGDEFLSSGQWSRFDHIIHNELVDRAHGAPRIITAEEHFDVATGIVELVYESEVAELARLSDRLEQLKIDDAAALVRSIAWGAGGLISVMVVMALVWHTEKSRRGRQASEAAQATLMRDLANQKLALDEHVIVSITDTRGIITYANDKFCELSGYTRDELIGQNHRLIKSDEHTPAFFHDMWNTLSNGRVWKGQIKNLAKGGTPYWVDATIVPLKDDRGQITQYIALRMDITERIALEARQSEVGTALDNTADCVFIFDAETLRFTYTNQGASRHIGYTSEEMAEMTPLDINPEFDQAKLDKLVRPLIERSQASLNFLTVHRHKDGHDIPVEVSLQMAHGLGLKGRFVAVVRDISARLESERVLRESERRFQIAVNGSRDGIWDWDLLTDRVYYASQWKKMLGLEAISLSNKPDEWISRIDKRDLSTFMQEFDEHLSGLDETFEVELRMIHKDGHTVWMLCRGAVVRDEFGQAIRVAGSLADITEIKQAQTKLQELAEHDHLTGLPNRDLFNDRLDKAIRRGKTDPEYQFAVLFFDFDRFKIINDSLGHNIGDALLIDIAELFRSTLRDEDTAARFGGDEFAVLLTGLTDFDEARRIAERLLEVFARPHTLSGHEVTSTASIGLVTNESPYTTAGAMIRDADAAMYQAKEAGKARIVLFDQQMHAKAMDRLQLENDLRNALDRDQFKLAYQPIVNLESGETYGYEALIRWDHPTRGAVSPDQFIPIAEDTGLIVPIGEWVLRKACHQLYQWNHYDRPEKPIYVNVNISMRQVCHPGIVESIRKVIQQTGIDPQYLKLEVTESTIVDDRHDMIPLLNEIKGLGIQLAMDDFGTGHSSLGNLHLLPVDVLKIDRSFITSMSVNRQLAAVMQTIITLAHELGMQTVAEGIETSEQLVMLQSMDCNFGQGYYFRKPLSAEDATRYLLDTDNGNTAAA